ncbi:unnamed protein product [Adineta steineri]|uniref:Uncharacterized protein n=1 Tax=Adineta steineri TaxID=433720 RepID=A0A818S6U7_9BILA|nr:unnamed protein product [Adineta steineri]CAF1456866.1 unnamed protein product [Adineta steineri]CAF3575695.1 unnamed protein product [Adineta steineri]CAF3668686.1 unnamed protein product [Adineta steineri]
MPISSKRNDGNQQTIYYHQRQQQQPTNEYDEYVHYPSYSNSNYDYREEPEQSRQYYDTRASNNSTAIYRT